MDTGRCERARAGNRDFSTRALCFMDLITTFLASFPILWLSITYPWAMMPSTDPIVQLFIFTHFLQIKSSSTTTLALQWMVQWKVIYPRVTAFPVECQGWDSTQCGRRSKIKVSNHAHESYILLWLALRFHSAFSLVKSLRKSYLMRYN